MFNDLSMFFMEKRQKSDSEEPDRLQRNDSFRKVLPSKPSASVDSRLSMSMRMVERPAASVSDRGTKAYASYMLEYVLLTEYQIFRKKEIPGLYVVPAGRDPLLWHGVLFLHQGFYQGGVFRFQVRFPDTFPDGDCPRVIFDENFFHPAISPETGDLNVVAEFPEWRKHVNSVWQVLQYAKAVFFKVDTRAPLNVAAAQILLQNTDAFREEAQKCVKTSISKLYLPPKDDDVNYIRFAPYDDNIHGSIRLQLSNGQ